MTSAELPTVSAAGEQPVGRILTLRADEHPERAALTCGPERMTYAELEAAANRLARAYEALGVWEGDFVTIALPNGVEFIVACFAAWKLGAVPQPVSWRLPERERAAIVELADSSLVVGVPPGSHGGRTCVTAGFVPDPSLSDAPIEPDREAPSWKATTSGGSTGQPKLIVSGGRGRFDPTYGKGLGMQEGGTQLLAGPLYHNAPFGYAMLGLYLGNHVVVLPRFDARDALDAIEEHHVDWVFLVPTMMSRIARVIDDDPGRFDLSSLRTVWHAAAPCPPWLKQRWIELIGPDKLFELYGGTESQALTIITGREWLEHRGSVGKPAYGEMKVLDPEGQPLPPGEVGEIFMRSPMGSPATYRYIGSEARARDGWESIGDLGWFDDDGYLYLSDRRTDMIVAGGANIYPAEVEGAILEHDDVESCVVVGVPDDDLGQRVHAVVQASGPLDEEELRAFLRERLVAYKIPRSFRFADDQLRGDDGKVRRSAVREQEAVLLARAEGRS